VPVHPVEEERFLLHISGSLHEQLHIRTSERAVMASAARAAEWAAHETHRIRKMRESLGEPLTDEQMAEVHNDLYARARTSL
jgi:hypothetical protein